MRSRIIFSLLLAIATLLVIKSSPAQEVTNFYSKSNLPIYVVRTAQYQADIDKLDVDTDLMKEEFKRRSGFSFDGKRMTDNDDYIQTFAMYTRRNSHPVCVIRVGEGFYDVVFSKGSLSSLLVLAHESAHCPQLSSFLKRDQYEQVLPGVRYLRNSEIIQEVRSKRIGRKEGIFLLKYSEYIREVAADISSLLYLRHVHGLDDLEMLEVLEFLKKKRALEDTSRYPNSVGHKTTPFLEVLDLVALDSYKEQFLKDTFLASMQLAYTLDDSFTFTGFKKKYGHLALTTNHF